MLQGRRLCLYLDPATEWNPSAGWPGIFERLWDWFDDAIANRFDPTTALYHPVGGVLHRTSGTPTVVVTQPLDGLQAGFHATGILLRPRTSKRIDLVAWNRSERTSDTIPGIVVVLSDSLPRGGGAFLSDLAVAIRGQDARHERRKFLATVLKTGRLLRADQYLHVLISVPNRHLTGEAGLHLIGWRLPQPAVESAVNATQHRHRPDDPHPRDEPEVEWTYIDDCRRAVTMRRDIQRPVHWYAGKTIEIWGCGAVGSWLAENVARAHAGSIILRDNGYVTKGLLVRQNYTEDDVGSPKVEALARRLVAISDGISVEPIHGLAQSAVFDFDTAHLIFDCTVNTSVALILEQAQASGGVTIPVAQVATDNDTSTLGVLTVTTGRNGETSNQIDQALHQAALTRQQLRPFKRFWDPHHHAPLTPTLGCSIPTFHGSSADSQVIASSAATLTALALSRRIAAGYLFASPHTPYDVPPATQVPMARTNS